MTENNTVTNFRGDTEITCPVCGCSDWKLFKCNWTSSTALGIECNNCGLRNNELFTSKVRDLCDRLKLKGSDYKNKGGKLIKCPHDGSDTWKLFVNDQYFSVSCPGSWYYFGGKCHASNAMSLDSEVRCIWQLIDNEKADDIETVELSKETIKRIQDLSYEGSLDKQINKILDDLYC